MPGNPIYPPLSPRPPLSCLPPATPPLTPIPRASLHPLPPCPSLRRLLHRLPPPPHFPPAVDAPWHPLSLSSGTATRATPQPYFFHSVLSIDQVLNFRVHPSRASTSSSSASSTSCLLLLLLLAAPPRHPVRPLSVLVHPSPYPHPTSRCTPMPPVRSSPACPSSLFN